MIDGKYLPWLAPLVIASVVAASLWAARTSDAPGRPSGAGSRRLAEPITSGAAYDGAPPLVADDASPHRDPLFQGISVETNEWIEMACAEAVDSVREGGGPFGAVVVQIDDETGEVLRYWRERNHVTAWCDPTAHAEVSCVRAAAQSLGVYNLGLIRRDDPGLKLPQTGATSHCEIYSSCEPCPMCYASIRWARIKTIVFAATRFDAAEPGVDFSDLDFYEELDQGYAERNRDGLEVLHSRTPHALDAFRLWAESDVTAY